MKISINGEHKQEEALRRHVVEKLPNFQQYYDKIENFFINPLVYCLACYYKKNGENFMDAILIKPSIYS